MKIQTEGPVDLMYSNQSGPSAETISTLGQTLGTIGASAVQRQRQLSEVEQKCGKRPLFKGKKLNAWNDCAKKFNESGGGFIPTQTTTTTTSTDTPPPPKPVPKWVWVVSGVAVLGIVGFVIYKSTRK